MFDPVSQALAAISARGLHAAPAVFLAGAASSIGPCVAPRLLAVAGLAAGKPRVAAGILACSFVTGLTATYAAFGAVSSLLANAVHFSAFTYWAVAAALGAGGCATLWRGAGRCDRAHRGAGAGAAVLLGASFALVVSPCCTPLLVGILAYASASGSASSASALLAAFALGHALPVLAVAFGVNGFSEALERYAVRQAASVVSATLMLALAVYYAVLA